jgi:excisionase family DNA binding protein
MKGLRIQKKQYLSIGEAAFRLGVHPDTLRRWGETGEITPMVTDKGHRRYSVEMIDEFYIRNKNKMTPISRQLKAIGDSLVRLAAELTNIVADMEEVE